MSNTEYHGCTMGEYAMFSFHNAITPFFGYCQRCIKIIIRYKRKGDMDYDFDKQKSNLHVPILKQNLVSR